MKNLQVIICIPKTHLNPLYTLPTSFQGQRFVLYMSYISFRNFEVIFKKTDKVSCDLKPSTGK